MTVGGVIYFTLAPQAMAQMTLREGRYGGAPMRVLRASFSGELSYELNVPALYADALLRRLAEAGHVLDARPYGVEAVMILRLEKGFLHVGADTDPIEKAGVPAFGPMQDNRFYFNYHHTAADTLDKVAPRELQENAGVVAVAAYAFANAEQPLPREK